MTNEVTESINKVDQQPEADPLMEAYNPLPPQAEQPARFYWQGPWHDSASNAAADGAIQAAFEN